MDDGDRIDHDDPLFDGVRDKVEVAINRLRVFAPPEGYYLAFSGGKDSCVIKVLADMAGVKYDAHYSSTTIDPPELVRFIREKHPDVSIEAARVPFLRRLVEKGAPQRHRRWCCAEYKERPAPGRVVLTGIRAAESAKRAGRRMVERCLRDKSQTYMNAILDWTDADVWGFLRGNGIDVCSLYEEGRRRIGCLFCPMATVKERAWQARRWPKYERAFRAAFRRLYEKNRDREAYRHWADGDAMFDWWMSNDPASTEVDQTVLFE